jgi:hypothetical protein
MKLTMQSLPSTVHCNYTLSSVEDKGIIRRLCVSYNLPAGKWEICFNIKEYRTQFCNHVLISDIHYTMKLHFYVWGLRDFNGENLQIFVTLIEVAIDVQEDHDTRFRWVMSFTLRPLYPGSQFIVRLGSRVVLDVVTKINIAPALPFVSGQPAWLSQYSD